MRDFHPSGRRAAEWGGQLTSVDDEPTARENLVLLGRLLSFARRPAEERASELLDAFGLTEARRSRREGLLGGMRRRLDIVASIVVTPACCSSTSRPPGSIRSRNQV